MSVHVMGVMVHHWRVGVRHVTGVSWLDHWRSWHAGAHGHLGHLRHARVRSVRIGGVLGVMLMLMVLHLMGHVWLHLLVVHVRDLGHGLLGPWVL